MDLGYDIYDCGFDKHLNRALPPLGFPAEADLGLPSYLKSDFFETSPSNLASGELAQNISMVDGYLQSSNFVSGSTGWRIDSDGKAELCLIFLYSNTADAITIDYGSDILLKHGGDIKFTSVTAPTACTATLIETDTGNIDNGDHIYKVTFVNDHGETELGTVSNTVTIDNTHKQVSLTAIPISSSASVTSRKIYRTKVEEDGYYLLTTINNNMTTIYTDNTADADLGVDGESRTNDTFGKIEVDGVMCGSLGSKNVFLGYEVGLLNTVGSKNVFTGYRAGMNNTTGYSNNFIGFLSGFGNTTGSTNTFLGYYAGMGYITEAIGTGTSNTLLGAYTGRYISSGSRNVYLGYSAGARQTTENDQLLIDNRYRTTAANDRAQALIYGVFAATPANQKLTINGLLNQSVSKTPASATATGVAGDICWDASYIYICTATDTWKRVGIATW